MTYMAIDQYGQHEHDLGPHPRKELLQRCGRKSAKRMFVDTKDGVKHIGWVIGDRWFRVFQVIPMRKAA